MLSLNYRPADPTDLPAVQRLLSDLDLPVAGVEEWLDEFIVAVSGEEIVAVVGLERYGPVVLLRSVAVRPFLRNVGVGRTLVSKILAAAWAGGAEQAYLLTTTAEAYFARSGFVVVERAAVPAALHASVEFREACPATATAMSRALSSSTRN